VSGSLENHYAPAAKVLLCEVPIAGQGFIAHELAEVLPYAVHGEKDGLDRDGNPSYQGVDYSKIVPSLVKAIQELNTKFEEYKATHP
jgi:hypothetical protein